MTDEELIIKLQSGDEFAFDEIFRRYSEKAVRTAYLITGSTVFCDDIVQDTFIICYRSIKKLRKPGNFRAWFYKILTNTSIRYKKKLSNIISFDEFAENTNLSENKSFSDTIADNTALYDCIDKLSSSQKTAIILFYFNGLSVKEIAKATNSLEATVKSRLFFAKKKLRKLYSEGGKAYE